MAREMPKQQTLSRQNYSTYPNDFYAITNKIKADNKQKILDGEDKSGRNLLDTGINLLGSTLEGFAGFTEGIGDTLQYGLSTGANLVGLKGASKALKENADFDATGSLFGRSKEANIASDQWLDKARQKSYAPEVVAGVGNTFGQVAGAAGLGYALGGAAGINGAGELTAAQQKAQMGINAASAFTSSYGNTKSELRRAGYDDKTATEKAFVSGMSEAISEQFFDGIPGLRSAGWADNVVDKVGKGVGKYFGTKTGKIAMKMLENTGEGFEEVLSNMFNSIGDNIIGKFDKNYAFKNANVLKDTFSKDSLDNFIMATISTALMNGSAGAINSYQRNQLIRAYAKDNGISVQEAKNVLMPTQEVTQEQPVDVVEESQTQEQPVDVVNEQSIQQPTQEQPQTTENEAPVDVIEETRPIVQETQNEAQEQVKEPIQEQQAEPKTQEVYQEGRYKNLTEEDRNSMDEIFAKQRRGEQLNKQDKDTLQYLQRKNKGLKNPELKIINKFEDFSKDHYAIKKEEFKNFDTTALDNAEKAIQANKSGRRTKQQWLDIAENIGSQLDNVDSDSLKKYAIESFLYAQPNQKQNLNRQSQGYVDFKEEEWVNAVYKGAKVGQKVQEIKNRLIEDNKTIDKYSTMNQQEKNRAKMINSYEANREIREAIQGDSFEKVEGGLTEKELKKKIEKEKTNYIGKEVLVDNQKGKIKDRPKYGKYPIELEDGTIINVEKDKIQPFEDKLSKINNKQEKNYIYEIVDSSNKQIKEPNIAEQRKENVLEIPKEKVVQTGKEGEQFFEKQGAPKEVAKILSERPRTEKPKLKEKIKTEIEKQKQYIKDIRRQFVDKGQELYDVGKITKNDELYPSFDFAGMSEANAQYQIGKGQTNNEGFLYKNFTDKDGNKVPMSLEGMWKDIDDRGYGGVMDEYIGHYLNTDIYGKPTASSQKDINAIMDQVASGFMTPEDAEKAIDASTKIQSVYGEGITKEDSLKRIKEIEKEYPGIKEAAENVWQFGYNMLDNMVDAGLVSQREAKRMKEETPHYARLQRNVEEQSQSDVATDENSVKVKSPIQERKGGTQDIIPFRDSMADYVRSVAERKRMNKIGIELAKSMKTNIDSNIDDKVIDETGFTFGDALKENENGTYTLKYFDKGKPKQLVINKGIYEALQPRKNFEFEDWLPFKITGKVSKIQRGLITGKNILFSVANVPKDFLNGMFSTKYSIPEYTKNYFSKALPQLLNNGEYAQRYQALGGNQNTYYNYEEGYIKDKSEIKALKAGQTIINGIERFNNFGEQIPRLAEFITSLEHGDSVQKAMHNAAEITINFKRGGDVAKAIDRVGANYFNPSIQGTSKFVRNFTEAVENKQYAKILTRTALLGIAPAILGELMWGDDDEYKELPDYQKDNYFLFKKGNGDWIRIPKGQVQGALQALPRRAFTASRGQKNAFAGVGNTFGQVAPNNPIDDSVIGPFIAVARNKAWSGNPIVSDYLKNEDYPEDEYTSKTDEFSKWLGKKLHKSPAKINYLLDQYTGGIGDFVLPNLTKRTTKENTSGINAITNPLKDKFITNTTYSNKAQSDFYDALNHAENAKKHYGNNSEQALEYEYLNSVSQKISEKRKELEEIQSSNAPRKEKYEKAKELQDEMNKMARDAVKVKPKKEDGAISFGGTLYYKDGNEYKKASDKDEQKREFSGMSISDYYRSKIEQQKENKAAKEEKEKTKQSALSAFDLKEKDYDKYQYNISQFKADKDGEGKTIRGSKKDKVIDYVEGLPISDVQKAILIKGEGLSYKKYDDAIEDWLNSSKLNDDEKQKVKDYYKIK